MSVRETGILRKKTHAPQNFDDLLIVGYQSRLFRDDEKAIYIDQGRHLIPWMGDSSLKIDRYDVRATLSDLTAYEAPPGGYANRLDYLTPAEQKAEQLCEEERYYSLYRNEIEEEMYQEEAQKRQLAGYGQVGFNYDAPPAGGPQQTEAPQEGPEEEPDDPFEPFPNFEIPRHIEPPETMRLNAIIEKTARFIAEQGVQMEILIKAKQSNNPQFDFLNVNGRCNAYYKLLVEAIKEGKYPNREEVEKAAKATGLQREAEKRRKQEEAAARKEASNGGAEEAPVIVPTLKYVPSEDCAYTQLISKIKGTPIAEIQPTTTATTPPPPQVEEKPPTVAVKPVVDFKNKSNSVEVRKISSGLMLAQCYNSDSEDEEEDEDEGASAKKGEAERSSNGAGKKPPESPLEKFDVPIPPDDLRTIVDKTAVYVAKNGKDFEDILRTKNDPRFAFLDESSPFHRYYIYKVTGTVYLPATVSPTTKEERPPVVVQPVSFTIKPLLQRRDAEGVTTTTTTGEQPPAKSDLPKLDDSGEEEPEDDAISVAELLEREERKEIRRVEERVRDKLAAAAREKLGLVSKEKQLQQERKRKAMEFLMKIKGNGGVKNGSEEAPVVSGTSTPRVAEQDESEEVVIIDDDKEEEEDGRESKRLRRGSRSRSRSRSSYRSVKRRSRSRSKSRHKSKKKRRSTDRERRHKSKKKSSSRRYSRSSSGASRSRTRSRTPPSKSKGKREKSRHH